MLASLTLVLLPVYRFCIHNVRCVSVCLQLFALAFAPSERFRKFNCTYGMTCSFVLFVVTVASDRWFARLLCVCVCAHAADLVAALLGTCCMGAVRGLGACELFVEGGVPLEKCLVFRWSRCCTFTDEVFVCVLCVCAHWEIYGQKNVLLFVHCIVSCTRAQDDEAASPGLAVLIPLAAQPLVRTDHNAIYVAMHDEGPRQTILTVATRVQHLQVSMSGFLVASREKKPTMLQFIAPRVFQVHGSQNLRKLPPWNS